MPITSLRQWRTLLASAILLTGARTSAQDSFEVRLADTKYRYVGWNRTLNNSAMIDIYYTGSPGSNELNMGIGYAFKAASELKVAPLIYAVLGKERGQRGLQVGFQAAYQKSGWSVYSCFGHFVRLSGEVANYQFLDTLDITHVLHKQWELGISHGFLHARGAWNPQTGPLCKWNDRFGYWAASYRFGPQREFRVSRTIALK